MSCADRPNAGAGVPRTVKAPLWGSPPRSEAELLARADALAGLTLGELGATLSVEVPKTLQRHKGLVGQLLERALGCDGGNRDGPDFVGLGVELKTLPVAPGGAPKESTFVSSISLGEIASAEFFRSRVYRKLGRVLFVPIEADPALPVPRRRIGSAILWSPKAEQLAVLRADWELLVGMIACGERELISAHLGTYLQVRPKAAHSRVRTTGLDAEGLTRTLPIGFYLRARLTAQILADFRDRPRQANDGLES